jgi:hypothetical protein
MHTTFSSTLARRVLAGTAVAVALATTVTAPQASALGGDSAGTALTTRKFIRRCSGTWSGRQASRGTTVPVRRRSSLPIASGSGPRRAGTRSRTASAQSGTGTKLVRSCLGRARISAITTSLRKPGTDQPKSSASTLLIRSSGTFTVTPSAWEFGSNS